MIKILLVTYYWPPAGGPGTQRWLKFVKYLSKENYDIHVVTIDPQKASYPLKDNSLMQDIPSGIKIHYTSSFEPLHFYKKLNKKKEIPYGGFAGSTKKGFIEKIFRFIRGNFFIPDVRITWNKYAYKKANELIKKENINRLIITSPPHSSQLIGLKLKRKHPSIKWIADLRDPWTDIFYYNEFYHTRPAKAIDKKYERKVLELCDKCIVVSDSIKEIFAAKSKKINRDNILILPNGYDAEDFKQLQAVDKKKFIITYTGTMSEVYNINIFLNSLSNLVKQSNTTIEIRIIGKISLGVLDKIKKSDMGRYFKFIEYIEHEKIPFYLTSSAALLLVIPDVENNEGILTGKLFEYIGAQRAIICLGPKNGDAAKIIANCNTGRVFDKKDEGQLTQYLIELIDLWKQNKISPYGNSMNLNYSRKKLTEHLIKML